MSIVTTATRKSYIVCDHDGRQKVTAVSPVCLPNIRLNVYKSERFI